MIKSGLVNLINILSTNNNVAFNADNYLSISIWIVIVYLLGVFIFYLNHLFNCNKLKKRVDKFAIKPINNYELSDLEILKNKYQLFISKTSNNLKLNVFSKYINYLDKYSVISKLHKNGKEIFIGKFIVGFLMLFVALITTITSFKVMTSIEVSFTFIIGFFLLDLFYLVKYKVHRNKIENDLLSAIIVMNNAFKSGRSITQAIDIVTEEIEGEIALEFEKMKLELSYGLGIDDVFKRFADRIKIPEVNYLTSSLTILNQTGGNIVEVFNSIEKNLFNKKKLRLELKTLTGSSRIIVYVICMVPILFILFIRIIDKDYFTPLLTTNLGLILSLFMVIYYILFIFFVRKIMKVVI